MKRCEVGLRPLQKALVIGVSQVIIDLGHSSAVRTKFDNRAEPEIFIRDVGGGNQLSTTSRPVGVHRSIATFFAIEHVKKNLAPEPGRLHVLSPLNC